MGAFAGLGTTIGQTTYGQGISSIALGYFAGRHQADGAIAMGLFAGTPSGPPTGEYSISIGRETNNGPSIGDRSVAIGSDSSSKGEFSVAYGHNSSAADDKSIVINGSGTVLSSAGVDTFTVKPIRDHEYANTLHYNNTTGEITYYTNLATSALPLLISPFGPTHIDREHSLAHSINPLGGTIYYSQFMALSTGAHSKVSFISGVGGTSSYGGNSVIAGLYDNQALAGTPGSPGNRLAHSHTTGASSITAGEKFTITFDAPVTLTKGEHYWLAAAAAHGGNQTLNITAGPDASAAVKTIRLSHAFAWPGSGVGLPSPANTITGAGAGPSTESFWFCIE